MMKRWIPAGFLLLLLITAAGVTLQAHNAKGASITWNREISRVFYNRCASCHRQGGTAFSLMTYLEAQPRAFAIKDAVLQRRMPPWGAVKGFGDFRNDQGLTQEELELITDWVEGGISRGNNPNALPKTPKLSKPPVFKPPKDAVLAVGEYRIDRAMTIDGIFPRKIPQGASPEIVAALPDGAIQPLVWLYEYKNAYEHPFLFREPMDLPVGAVIRGLPPGAEMLLIPGKKKAATR